MALPSDGVAYNISRNTEYIQKISNRNGSIAHIAGNTYAHPFSTQQAIGTIHIDAYIYKLYTHLPRFTGLSQRPCTTSAVRTRYNAEVAEGSFTNSTKFLDPSPERPYLRHTWTKREPKCADSRIQSDRKNGKLAVLLQRRSQPDRSLQGHTGCHGHVLTKASLIACNVRP